MSEQLSFILRPPWPKIGRRIESIIRKTLYTHKMLEKHSKIIIALSGGKDSLTLLMMLKAISGRGFPHIDLSAIHINGKFSCGAGVSIPYLKLICDHLNIPFKSINSEYNPVTPECYSCSQVRRRLLFREANTSKSSAIAFGHHKDDNAQTILMNVLHKGEFAGLPACLDMIHFDTTILRPLILVPEKAIIKFSKECGFARVSCQCPVISLRKKSQLAIQKLETDFPLAKHNLTHAAQNQGSNKCHKVKPSK